MAKENPKPAAAGTQAAPAPPTAKRNRAAISPAKALAITVAGLVAILKARQTWLTLNPAQQEQVAAASKAAAELNAKTLQPVLDRIKEIQEEFKKIDITAVGAADKAKELSIELGRKQTKLAALTQSASA